MTTMRAGVLAASLLCGLPAAADTLFVDDDNPCPGTGTSSDEFCLIQLAVDAAAPTGDIIRVRPGSYVGCVNGRIPPKAVAIEAEDPDPAQTVLDGSSCFSVSVVELADGSRLSGFRIVNGNEGAIASAGSVTITGNVIQGNGAQFSGGGIFADSAVEDFTGPRTIDILIEGNTIRGNDSQRDGGGIWVAARSEGNIDVAALVQSNAILENVCAGVGAGIAGITSAGFGSSASLRITDNQIQSNAVSAATGADGYGGGVWVSTSSEGFETLEIDHNTVGAPTGSTDTDLGNTAVRNGGAISATILATDTSDHALFVTDNVVRANSASLDAGGIELFVDGVDLDLPSNPTPGRYSALIAFNDVVANTAENFGGGILADVGTLETTSRRNPVDIAGNVLSGNQAGEGGGGAEARAFAFGTSFTSVALRFNTVTGNVVANDNDDAFGGGLSLFAQTEGTSISRLDARFNTITGNTTELGGGGIDVQGVTVPDGQGDNGSTFIEITNSRIENNTGFGVGGPPFDSEGTFQLTLRSLDLTPNSAGETEPELIPNLVQVCMPAATPAALNFPGVDADEDVDGIDLLRLATAFASVPGAVHYNPLVDLDGDLEVDGNDLAILSTSFGDTCP